MKNLIYSVCLLFCLGNNVNTIAQVPVYEWAKSFSAYPVSDKALHVNAGGDVFTCGNFMGTIDLNPDASGTVLATGGTDGNLYISKLNTAGNYLNAVTVVGTSGSSSINVSSMTGNSSVIFITGLFSGTIDFDPGMGTSIITAPSISMFIACYDFNLNLIWAKQICEPVGFIGMPTPRSIACDASGSVCVTGDYLGDIDFDPSSSTFTMGSGSLTNSDFFVLRLNSSGNFLWAKSIGHPTNDEMALSMCIDNGSNVVLGGYFRDTVDFDPGTGTTNLIATSTFYSDIFIMKLSPTGNFMWAKKMGGRYNDNCVSISTDYAGRIFATGNFTDTADFDPGFGVYNLVGDPIAMWRNFYVIKLDQEGGLEWAKYLFMETCNYSFLTTDYIGDVYLTGNFKHFAVDFDPGVGTYYLPPTGPSATDSYILKLNAAGNFAWVKNMGGTGFAQGYGIVVGNDLSVYSVGTYEDSCDFDPDAPTAYLIDTSLALQMYVHKLSLPVVSAVAHMEEVGSISIFPNPVSDQQLNFSEMVRNVRVYNSYGQLCYVKPDNATTVNVTPLAKGVYTIVAEAASGIIVKQKFVKE